MPPKNLQKLICESIFNLKAFCLFCFSWNLAQQKCFIRKRQSWQSLVTKNGESHEKNCSETGRSMAETRFYIKQFISICTRENSSHPAQVFFFCQNFTLIVARYYRHVRVLFVLISFVDSDAEDHDIFDPESSFAVVFNTF